MLGQGFAPPSGPSCTAYIRPLRQTHLPRIFSLSNRASKSSGEIFFSDGSAEKYRLPCRYRPCLQFQRHKRLLPQSLYSPCLQAGHHLFGCSPIPAGWYPASSQRAYPVSGCSFPTSFAGNRSVRMTRGALFGMQTEKRNELKKMKTPA